VSLLPSVASSTDSSTLLAASWPLHFEAVRLRGWHGELAAHREDLVTGAEGLLLYDSGQWVLNHSIASARADSTANSVSNATSDAATHAATPTASHSASHSTAHSSTHAAQDTTGHSTTRTTSPSWTRRPLQLCGWTVFLVATSQAAVVLQFPPYLWPADGAASASRSLQLSGWLRELAGRLVSSKEGVVLSRSWKGMPESRRWLRDIVRTLRL